MKIIFQGKSCEYRIEKSYFCSDAFLVKDKIQNRDGVDFITSNVQILQFSDNSFTFDEILAHLSIDSENTIIVEDFLNIKN